MTGTDRRGEAVALLGMLYSLLAAAALAVLAIYAGSTSGVVWALAFLVFGNAGIWLLTLIQLHQRRLLAEERLEVAELERQRQDVLRGAKSIFEEEELDQMEQLAMGRRLRTIERYLIPIVALVFAGYHLVAGSAILPWGWQFPPIVNAEAGAIAIPMLLAIVCGAVALACFMLTRYALGMSRIREWNLLCAGGNFAFGSSIAGLVACLALLCASGDLRQIEIWASRGIGILMMILAAETIINYVLDFYRPRVATERHRPFYDSRILGMFSEPGGILHSLANAVDYQFGFKVSETWFYKLLGRAVLPLLLIQFAVICLLTCFVVVPPGHQAVVEHYGPYQANIKTYTPGVHFTWPWPIDRATLLPVDSVQRMELGYDAEAEKRERTKHPANLHEPLLWSKAHYKKEYKLLVADEAASIDNKVPVNLLSMTVPVQWRIKPDPSEVIRYYLQAQDVSAIIESLAYREITYYAAQTDVFKLLGEGGTHAAQTLQARLQEACDHAGQDGRGLGVQIVYVGVGMIHPPSEDDVAKTYEEVISAYELRQSLITQAEGEAAERKVSNAGQDWKILYDAVISEDQARQGNAMEAQTESAAVEQLLREKSSGKVRQLVATAYQRTLARVFGEKASSERYLNQIKAFEAAPSAYMLRLYLRTLEEGLAGIQKYLVVCDDPSKIIYLPDTKPPQGIDILGAELSAAEQKEKGGL